MKAEILIPKLVRACLDNNKQLVEEISFMLVKVYKKHFPEISREISQSLTFSRNGVSALRSADILPAPVDRESRLTLGKIEEPIEISQPILTSRTFSNLFEFLEERKNVEALVLEGIVPPNSMLFVGPPGVGKTYTAKWISYKLNLPLFTMDLASSISSYLGRSGQNLKELFDYSRTTPSILFLDELDAIAKRRDDASDLGELKRLVNVLLKEMESWSSHSIIIAATNHPELLDKAIWRRFDRIIEFEKPGSKERKKLVSQSLGKYEDQFSASAIDFFIKHSDRMSAADICKTCMHIKRKAVMEPSISDLILIEKVCDGNYETKQEKIDVCTMLKKSFPELSLRDIARITKVPFASVGRYIQ